MQHASNSSNRANSPRRVLFASLIGTSIEFFDFYAYATAAVLIFPKLFFPTGDPASATLQSLATFALAFFARPLGAALFGHFGDRVGRKATLVAALLTMGTSTVLIGFVPTYAAIGVLAPIILALCRLGQGLGLGGEWGGAVLFAAENAPAGKRAWYGMFPQLGAPIGFLGSTGLFLLLSALLSDVQFFAWGWRIPFLASSALVVFGLYVRLRLTETPEFERAIKNDERVRVPMLTVFATFPGALVLATLAATSSFVIVYLMIVFTLGWDITQLGYSRPQMLGMQLIGMLFLALMIPLAAKVADRATPRAMMLAASLGLVVFGLNMAGILGAGGFTGALAHSILGLSLAGLIYGPLGTALADLFPTPVRYTGISLSFNLAGILGASLTPYIASSLAARYGLAAVGYYLAAISFVSLVAVLLISRGATFRAEPSRV